MHLTPPQLNPEFCRARQERVIHFLKREGLDGAVFFNRFYTYALTGYWHEQPLTPAALYLGADGQASIVTHEESPHAPAADELLPYQPNYLFTLRENLPGCVAQELNKTVLKGATKVGTDLETPAAMLSGPEFHDITSEYQEIRRFKDPDEVEALEFTIQCADKAYLRAKEIISPGITEAEVMSAMLQAATGAAGEILSGFGQDYKCGAPGGFARRREIEAGEIFVLDVGIGVRGYRSDLCRAFSVSGQPSDLQKEAHEKILSLFPIGEAMMMPGKSCKAMFETVHAELDGWKGYQFFHHAGHGIGLDAHEFPRINSHWDDTFQVGDVVAFEPGLYHDSLKGGIRLENNYLITEEGPKQLSHFPMDL